MECNFQPTGNKHPKTGLPELRCTYSRCSNVTYTNHHPSKIHFTCKHPTIFALGDFISFIIRTATLGYVNSDSIPKPLMVLSSYYFYVVTLLASFGIRPIWIDYEKGCDCKRRKENLNKLFSIKMPEWMLTPKRNPSVPPQTFPLSDQVVSE